MTRKKYFLIKNYTPPIFLVLLWIILSEFIIPTIYFLPKPSVVLESFSSLWNDYNLLFNFYSTLGCIYLSLFISIIFSLLLANTVMDKKLSKYLIKERNKGLLFFLISSSLILSTIWFPDYYFFKIIFAAGISTSALTIKNLRGINKVDSQFMDSMKSLGFSKSVIQKKIIPKLLISSQINYLKYYQFVLWTILIIYEILIGREGIGFMINKIVAYRDLSAAIALLLILGFMILLLNRIYCAIINNFNYQNDHE